MNLSSLIIIVNVTSNQCVSLATLASGGQGSWQSADWMKFIIVGATTLTVIVGIVGNSVVITAIMRYRRLKSARNIFILNLSICDLLVLILALPIGMHYYIVREWIFGSFMCRAVPSFESISVSISSFTLAVIAIDVFILTIFPSWPPLNALNAWITVCFIWVLAVTGSIPRILSHGLYDFEGRICETICYDHFWKATERQKYEMIMLIVQFAIPITIILFCYGKVVYRLRELERMRRMSNAGCSSLKRRRRGTRLLICMMLVFLIFNTLDIIIKVLKISRTMPALMAKSEDFISSVSHLLCTTTAIWNPILYAFLNKNLREVFGQMFSCQKPSFESSLMSMSLQHRLFTGRRSTKPSEMLTPENDRHHLDTNMEGGSIKSSKSSKSSQRNAMSKKRRMQKTNVGDIIC